MSDVTSATAEAVTTDSPVSTPSTNGTTSEPVITREQTTAERVEADNAELDGELQKVLDKAKTGNDRADKGKFQAKTLPEGKVAADGEKTDAAKDAGKEGAEKPEAEKTAPTTKPPQSWPAKMQEKFAKYDPEDQQFFAKREAEAHRTISQQGQQIKAIKPVADTLEKYRGSFEKNGVTFDKGIAALVEASDFLDRDAPAAIRKLAEQYNVDLFDLIDAAPQGRSDPAISALQNEIGALKRELATERGERESRTRDEQSKQLQSVERLIEDFARDKPDFNDLEVQILGSIEAIREASPHLGLTDILQQAYDAAQWANPTTRQKMLDRQEKDRLDKARKEADDAKRASSINVRGHHRPVTDDDLDSELHGVLRKHRA